MIRYREFAISTASLATLSLVSGCDPTHVNGEWSGDSFITPAGETYSLPFSFEGEVTSAGFFGTSTTAYDQWTMDFDLSVDKNVGTLTRKQHKIYTYTYSYGEGYEPYVVDVDWQFERTYSGPVTNVGDRQFDIVMDLDDESQAIVINGTPSPEEEVKDTPTTLSAVLQCGTDGAELHCFQGTSLILFTAE